MVSRLVVIFASSNSEEELTRRRFPWLANTKHESFFARLKFCKHYKETSRSKNSFFGGHCISEGFIDREHLLRIEKLYLKNEYDVYLKRLAITSL